MVALAVTSAHAGYNVAAITGGGSISGKVVFEGTPPKPKTKTINKDPDTCGTGVAEYDVVSVGSGGALESAVVYISKIKQGKDWAEEMKGQFELDQRGCKFVPKTYVVKRGAKMKVANKDPVSHNVHSYEVKGRSRITVFNSGQPAGSEFVKPVRMRRKGSHGLKLECDIHNFMHGWMFVAENPYYSVTGKDGAFSIGDLPPGDYELGVWHPVLGEQSTKVTIAAGAKAAATFQYK
jgi:plastocyanin